MAEILMWLGAALLTTGLFGAAFDGVILGVLTPTQKSPERPGDREARRFTRSTIRLEIACVVVGAACLVLGLAIYLAV